MFGALLIDTVGAPLGISTCNSRRYSRALLLIPFSSAVSRHSQMRGSSFPSKTKQNETTLKNSCSNIKPIVKKKQEENFILKAGNQKAKTTQTKKKKKGQNATTTTMACCANRLYCLTYKEDAHKKCN